LHGKRNTPVKECIPPSLRIAATTIKAETTTETTEIATKTTADLGDVAMSARKRIADHGNIQRRNATRLRKSTETASTIELRDGLTTALRNALSSMFSTAKEIIVRT
jgi:hypothetical protein